ncbi:MAG: hypothetical protein EU548_02180 [Promethearchaeota archaeon]|nr:MAG: hypothetical protein EU548_02180 [Candidatus Lokiarchaeota archaeon]
MVIKLSDIRSFLKNNILYILGMVILAIFSAFILINFPKGAPFEPLEDTFYLFGLGLNSTILILSIGFYLLYRWLKGKRQNTPQLVWGICWVFYSWTFIIHIFRALGFYWANQTSIPAYFFLYRWVMVLFISGMYYGIATILTENKKLRIIPTILIFGIGISWFLIGLFVFGSPEFMMYGYLYCIWSPILFSIAYTFYLYGRNAKMRSPYLIALGFLGVGITYLAWAPWHFSDVIYLYFIWYFLFQLSLVPILLGFVLLTVESKKV